MYCESTIDFNNAPHSILQGTLRAVTVCDDPDQLNFLSRCCAVNAGVLKSYASGAIGDILLWIKQVHYLKQLQ